MSIITGNAALRRRDLTAGPALLSAVARAFAGPDAAQKLVETFHMMDLNQLYTDAVLSVVLSAGRH